jgi:hypothetical protein
VYLNEFGGHGLPDKKRSSSLDTLSENRKYSSSNVPGCVPISPPQQLFLPQNHSRQLKQPPQVVSTMCPTLAEIAAVGNANARLKVRLTRADSMRKCDISMRQSVHKAIRQHTVSGTLFEV